ncbi:hypothetical protein GO986_05965 [Deinococcus sp. HMF7620]|uniref:Uncharacterized protein n=1 Tax=Deinococcus arboris TaxID=2682977 RepID=A0A7C9HQX8_9DEIO|nr:hypothetical protein [Deinococcus arboris]MVN86307.1 hypothetical protein [Deinococcus arboris]
MSPDPAQLAQHLTALAAQDQATLSEAQPLVQAFWQAAQDASLPPDTALAWLLPGLSGANLEVAGLLGVAAGALVEAGADPEPGAEPLLHGLVRSLTGSVRLAEAYLDTQSAQAESEGDATGDGEAAWLQQARALAPDDVRAWHALDLFGRAGVTFLSRLPETRVAFRAKSGILAALDALQDLHEWADWLLKLLQAPYKEAMLVLHPGLGRGFWIEVSGVADNFQLHTLLAGALVTPGLLPGRAPSPAALAEALGETTEEAVTHTGTFNLVNWFGLRPDGTLGGGMAATSAWIWNEGVPADIALFEGERVILLTDPPYERTWTAPPMFSALRPEVRVTAQLSAAEVKAWLRRLAARMPTSTKTATPDTDAD